MADRENSCEERISSQMDGREESLRNLIDRANDRDDDEAQEQATEELDNYALGMTTYRVMRIDLSTGGPADWLECTLSRGRYGYEIEDVVYHFADWFDHAEQSVDQTSPLWAYAERYVDIAGLDDAGE